MDAAEVRDPAFWKTRGSRVLAPPRLAEEGTRIEGVLGDDGAIVFASSGSGGVPKWVALRREALQGSAEAVNQHLEVEAADRWMLALPLYHVGGFGVAARAFAAGCGLKCFAGRWDAMRFAEELGAHGVTLTSLVPTQVHDLVECDLRAPSSLRAVVVGGARLDPVVGQAARDLGWPVLQSYGMTEAASQVATAGLDSLTDPFQSSPLPVLRHWAHRIGPDGCLQLRGESLFDSYLRLAGDRLEMERPFLEGGWFATTDLVTTGSGGVTVTGRADRQVKILGELVDLEGLEEELQGHLGRGVRVRVLAVPDERRGWRLVPVIEEGGAGAEDVVGLVNERLPGFARLEKPHRVTNLPRTALGKVDEAVLRGEIGGAGNS